MSQNFTKGAVSLGQFLISSSDVLEQAAHQKKLVWFIEL